MLDFERGFPEIANKYFDLRFDQENLYDKQYGYGRKYENKPLCSLCKKNGVCWNEILVDDSDIEKRFIQLYFEKEIDFQCLVYKNSECTNTEIIVKRFIEILLKYSVEEIVDIICKAKKLEEVSKDNIPQYSSLNDAMFNVNQILVQSEESMSFEDLGYYLGKLHSEEESNTVAQKKYGENHSKMATLMDLAVIGKRGNKSTVYVSVLGKEFYKMEENTKNELARKSISFSKYN